MRTRMNASYSSLVFLVFHSDGTLDYPKIGQEAIGLRDTVKHVRGLKTPPMVKSDSGLEVYMTYNDTLQRNADLFVEAVDGQDPPRMQVVLGKIGQTCNDCHHFFRVDVEDARLK